MYDICVKKTCNGEMVLGLTENVVVNADEQVVGYAKAIKSDKNVYFCKDINLILSPGDVVYLNGIDGVGGWVEIVNFIRKEAERKDTAQKNTQGVQLYNNGVNLYGKNSFEEAIDAFNKCYNAGFYQMQSAYAISLCQQQLGVDITIPNKFEDKTDKVGTVFIGSNLVCKLINDGYKAALVGESNVLTIIDDSTYDIRVVSFLGSFMLNAWRKEQSKTIPLTDSSLNPNPTRADQFVISLVQDAASLPPYPLPDEGLPSSLE